MCRTPGTGLLWQRRGTLEGSGEPAVSIRCQSVVANLVPRVHGSTNLADVMFWLLLVYTRYWDEVGLTSNSYSTR